MKKSLITLLACAGAAIVFAQTAAASTNIDWRYKLTWTDPNPAGTVASWTTTASNVVTTAIARNVSTATPNVGYTTLLSGLPAGTYAIYNVATSALGDISTPSTNHYVVWPGGTGKINPGHTLTSSK